MGESNRRVLERRWAAGWRRAGFRLRELKQAELQAISTEEALQSLAGAFESCRLHFQPKPESGLVEQQRWFQKFRR